MLVVSAPEVPAEAAAIGVLIEREGALIAASGLVPWSSAEPLELMTVPFEGEGAEVVLVALTDEQLREVSAPIDPTGGGAPLRRAQAGEASLPSDAWFGEGALVGSRAELVRAPEPAALTADWLTRCGRTFDGARVDARCAVAPCNARIVQAGCRASLNLVSCQLGSNNVWIEAAGALVLDTAAGPNPCTPLSARSESLGAFECALGEGPCRLDLYPAAVAPRLEARGVAILEAPFLEPQSLKYDYAGYLGGLAVLGAEVVVTSWGGAISAHLCTASTPSRLHFVDAERLQIVRSATAPPCVADVARDPSGLGAFVGAHGTSLSRFDREGRVLFTTPPIAASGLGIELLGTASSVYVLVRSAVQGDGSRVVALDPTTLNVTATSPALPAGTKSLIAAEDGVIAVVDDNDDLVRLLDPRTLEIGIRDVLRTRCTGGGASTKRIAYHAGTRSVAVVIPHPIQALLRLNSDGTSNCGMGILYESDSQPLATTTWLDASQLIVGLTDLGGERSARVALLDPEGPRYLPGSTVIGRGVVSDIEVDPVRREAWAVLTSEARIVRLRPR